MRYLTYNLLSSTVAVLLLFLCPFFSYPRWVKYFFAVSFLVVFKYLCSLTIYPAYLSPLRHIPTPKRSLLWGNIPSCESLIHSISKSVNSEFPREQLVRYYFFNFEFVIATSPRVLDEVLHQRPHDFPFPSATTNVFSLAGVKGLLAEDGERHKMHRKVFSRWFSPQSLRQQSSKLVAVCTTLVRSLEDSIQSQPNPQVASLIMKDWIAPAALDLVALALFDIDLGSLRGDLQYYHAFKRLESSISNIYLFCASMFLDSQWLKNLPFAKSREILADRETVESLCSSICQREEHSLHEMRAEGRPKTFTSLAIEDDTFSKREVCEHILTFLGLGFKSISGTVQWAVHYLCRRTDIQERLRSELHAHLPSFPCGELPDTEKIQVLESLPYLNAFCNEVLRHSPPVVITIRRAAHDTTISGVFIPRETIIGILPEIPHKNAHLYGADANDFNPDRWLNPGTPYEARAAYIPFGHGMRKCPAQDFARKELLCLTAALISRFSMRLEDPDVRTTASNSIVPVPSDGARARLTALA